MIMAKNYTELRKYITKLAVNALNLMLPASSIEELPLALRRQFNEFRKTIFAFFQMNRGTRFIPLGLMDKWHEWVHKICYYAF